VGFSSIDSDFDVVSSTSTGWLYLSIDAEDRPDAIERPVRDAIDMTGWDIRKTLRLFRKSIRRFSNGCNARLSTVSAFLVAGCPTAGCDICAERIEKTLDQA